MTNAEWFKTPDARGQRTREPMPKPVKATPDMESLFLRAYCRCFVEDRELREEEVLRFADDGRGEE